jgi:hypothetical protein
VSVRTLQLAADNSRPAPLDPGYRWSLARGRCQRCHRTDCGVRTVGMRRSEVHSWTRLALCPPCTAYGGREGFLVTAGLPAPADDELAAIREAFRDESPGEPERPAQRRPRTVPAKFAATCPACSGRVAPGDLITRMDGRWVHLRCCS